MDLVVIAQLVSGIATLIVALVLVYQLRQQHRDSDIQLSSRNYIKETRKVKINNIEIGGDTRNTLMITGKIHV